MDIALAGMLGENKVCTLLDKQCSDTFRYVHNVPLEKTGSEGYYQVDFVIVCLTGIYCVEVKTWDCTVRCSDKYYWEVEYPNRTILVHSPCDQNMRHCKRLSALLNENIKSIVVFPDSTSIVDALNNVVHISDLVEYVSKGRQVLDAADVERISLAVEQYRDKHMGCMLLDFMDKGMQKYATRR